MATGDFSIIFPDQEPFSVQRIVASGTAVSINAGEPTKQGSAGAVAICVDGDGTTSQLFTGIAKSASTDTAAAAGIVQVWIPFPGIVYQGNPKSATAANTAAKVAALQGKRVVFDLTGTAWTVDSAAADSASANGLMIVGGDPGSNKLWFIMRVGVSTFNNLTT